MKTIEKCNGTTCPLDEDVRCMTLMMMTLMVMSTIVDNHDQSTILHNTLSKRNITKHKKKNKVHATHCEAFFWGVAFSTSAFPGSA